jgi:DNA helicase-2/ATP-dependent DNA helicase PcrA
MENGADAKPSWLASKPKAVLKKKTTSDVVKPYIAKAGSQQPGTALSYRTGDRVRHIRFGDGTVTNMELGPKDTKVTVMFDTCGQKVMYAAFAKLQKI